MKKITYIISVVMLVFLLSACGGNEEQSETLNYSSENLKYSSEFFSMAGEYTDEFGNFYRYSYAVPEFNIDSDDARVLNERIKEKFYTSCEMEMDSIENELSLTLFEVSYEEHMSGDILSFLIKAVYEADYISYGAYSINVKTGEMVDVLDFLAMSGLSKEKFLEEIKKAAENKYMEIYGNPGGNDYLMSAYEYTVSDDAVNMNVPMYIRENGNIFMVAKIGSVAGAAYYEHIADTGIKVIK